VKETKKKTKHPKKANNSASSSSQKCTTYRIREQAPKEDAWLELKAEFVSLSTLGVFTLHWMATLLTCPWNRLSQSRANPLILFLVTFPAAS
jgi:hypothetical protein